MSGTTIAQKTQKKLPASEHVLDLIPKGVSIDALREKGIIPIELRGSSMVIAASGVSATLDAQILAMGAGKTASLVFYPEAEISAVIRNLYDLKSSVGAETLDAIESVDDLSQLARQEVLSDTVDAPVIKLVNGVLLEAIRERSTDIHLEPFEDKLLVRYRIDGVLHDKYELTKGHQSPVTSRVKVMAKMDIAERFVPQDGRIGITLGDRAVDIRVSSLPTQHGERMVMRILDKARGLLSLEDLGMAPAEKERIDSLIRNPHGMILLTGPTGSGKSTSLYAIIQALARPEVNIITVEDPIEYDVPGVGQVQVNEKAGVTFASALRSILRQDPDIIMIGEMRDFDTAHIGIQSSLTGHLVLSTLHTNDSVSAVSRLVDMGIEPYLIAGSLLGVVAQRLVRRICPKCRKEVSAPAAMKKYGLDRVYRGEGCDFCGGTGYRGRFGLYEQFDVTFEIAEAISSGESVAVLKSMAKKNGMRSLLELGVQSVASGQTTPEEMIRVVGEV
ncbi:MAG: Flp pilus assembly complex ATPase component TadA [Synergistaceae bacterium]|jgi:type II secretory ATPase GspE/PulE/Tfp pilus assembly ATPase PilB-like protein|nr:Flp pilus assembly complex ATPase component TadA [Synergistaceae bacterium]